MNFCSASDPMHVPSSQTLAPSLGSLALSLALASLIGCRGGAADEDETFGSETMATEGTAGDGDGDPETSSDENDETPTTDEGSCGAAGCECEPGSCDEGLSCVDGTCQATTCGDMVVEGEEQCEDGNEVDGDGCDADCSYTAILQVETGTHHTCVLIEGGRVRCWGRGEFGQLGYANPNTVGDDEYPSDIGDVTLPGPALALSLGGQHSCAILQDGGLRCWGANNRGQLGYGNLDFLGDDEGLAGLASVSVPPVIEVQAGDAHTCARVGNGQIRCWGKNDAGECGYANSLAPTPELLLPGGALDIGGSASSLELGWNHACVRLIDGGLRCWGWGDSGRLGYASVTTIGDDEVPSAVGFVSAIPAGLPANTEIVDAALGGNHSCVLLGSGDVLCWGANSSGQLGQANLTVLGDDEAPSVAGPIQLGGPAIELTAGLNHTCALLATRDVICWGDNAVGQLGLGNIAHVGDDEVPSSTGTIDLGGEAMQISSGGNHSCAILANNDVICWGQNNFSQLGLGSSVTVGDNETPAEAGPVSVF